MMRDTERDLTLRLEVARLREETARLRQELGLKNQNINLLTKINRNMRAALSVREVSYLLLTAATAGAGLGFNRAALFLRDPDSDRLRGIMGIGPDTEEEAHRVYEDADRKRYGFDFYINQFYERNFAISGHFHDTVVRVDCPPSRSNVLHQVLAAKMPRIFSETDAPEWKGAEVLGELFTSEFLVASIANTTEALGVILVDNFFTNRPIMTEDVWALQTLCDFGASMLLSARHYEEAEKRSVIDDLTRIYNYRYLREKLCDEIERGRRYKRRFSVILADIDHFKNFNDKNGHLTGNKALKDMARIFAENIRTVDTVARFGGEEFMVVLPETERDGARRAAEKLLAKVRASHFTGEENQPQGRVTFSAGVASFPDDAEDFEGLIEAADRRLYIAKAQGRNCIVSE
ncbi:MAG: GGDEF domain-containing protein [Candidatus Hydrogenedentota bacterium]|nr:MAG: GGDEF domain-containing protein [Candidatus Hydrogenedentota bacterium]